MSDTKHETLKVLRYCDLVNLGLVSNRMTLKRWIERGDFPAPIRLGLNSIAWRASEVEKWLEQRTRCNSGDAA